MKRIAGLVLLGAFITLTLAACNNFIPAQTLNNPLGLNGKSMSLSTISTTSLTPQAYAHTAVFSGNKSTTIQDANISGVPSWATPHGFSTDINASSVQLQYGTPSSLPTSLTVTRTQLSLQLSQSGGPSVTWSHDTGTTAKQLLQLTQTTCGTSSCTYSVKAGSDLNGALANVSLTSSQMSTMWTIITTGASTDDVALTAKVTVGASTAIPSGTTMVLNLDDAKGTLTFH